MTISKELMLAILSMDAYNRGYGAGVGGLSQAEGTKIGTATIKKNAEDILEENVAKDAGFYAVSYQWGGKTVISYRGTDSMFGGERVGGSDVANGYSLAGGIPGGQQDALAIEFYKSVTNTTGFNDDPRLGNAILTGHSMGAGLAGYVAALYGKEAFTPVAMVFLFAKTLGKTLLTKFNHHSLSSAVC